MISTTTTTTTTTTAAAAAAAASSTNLFELTASISLSNMAVVMMDKGYFAAAFQTSKAAVTTLQIAIDEPNQKTGRAAIRDSLLTAHRFVTNCIVDDDDNNNDNELVPSSPAATFLRILSHDSTTFFTTTTKRNNTPAQQQQHELDYCLTAIRISDDDWSLLESSSMNFLTAIVLQNFAISSLLVHYNGTTTTTTSFQDYFFHRLMLPEHSSVIQDTIAILHLSRGLLEEAATRHDFWNTTTTHPEIRSSSSSSMFCGGGNTTPFGKNDRTSSSKNSNPSSRHQMNSTTVSFSRVKQATIIVLETLKTLLKMSGSKDQAFACLARLVQVRDQASVLNDLSLSSNLNCLRGGGGDCPDERFASAA